jgi:hypothetical protein
MRKEIDLSSLNRKKIKRLAWPTSILAVLAITVVGCSWLMPPPETASQKQVLANIDVLKCQAVDVNVYRCPAIDKPVCTPDYRGTLECIRLGKNGAVYVAEMGLGN